MVSGLLQKENNDSKNQNWLSLEKCLHFQTALKNQAWNICRY